MSLAWHSLSSTDCVVLRTPTVAKIPKHVTYEDATVLPLGINTAATCMFMDETLGLKWPFSDGSKHSRGKTVLIWGASSSVGSCGVQLATHAGYEVVGVASKRNHEMVKSLGANSCFDQSSSTLADDILKSLKGKAVVGAYDAIANGTTLSTLCEILDQSGEKKLVVAVTPGAEEKATRAVKIVTNFASAWGDSDVLKAIWQWVAEAMEDDAIKYMPHSEVVGKGLEDQQKAVD
ncbi:MAG: hypothetical protein M1818_001257 [Claussenomyces sp. TS43310]|nr:MAG: hypothetical protein M1818_001257 [Claussenomyces sp. TS43310]